MSQNQWFDVGGISYAGYTVNSLLCFKKGGGVCDVIWICDHVILGDINEMTEWN